MLEERRPRLVLGGVRGKCVSSFRRLHHDGPGDGVDQGCVRHPLIPHQVAHLFLLESWSGLEYEQVIRDLNISIPYWQLP
jgi:hypothetical protein